MLSLKDGALHGYQLFELLDLAQEELALFEDVVGARLVVQELLRHFAMPV